MNNAKNQFLNLTHTKIQKINNRLYFRIAYFSLMILVTLSPEQAQSKPFPKDALIWGEKEIVFLSKSLKKSNPPNSFKFQDIKKSFSPYNFSYTLFNERKAQFLKTKSSSNNNIKKNFSHIHRQFYTPNISDLPAEKNTQALIIGGGQSGLAVAYFLKRHKIDCTILDSEEGPGGAWRHGWDSLRLFSPAQWSSLPGWPMPSSDEAYPSKDHVIHYLAAYEKKYNIAVERPIKVKTITKENENFVAHTDKENWTSQVVVSTTGKWSRPFIPSYPGMETYKGLQIHSAYYQNPDLFKGQKVLVVGGGNSGAQILAEVSKVAQTIWVTFDPPLFLPDEVDGRVLFERATEKWKALQQGRTIETPKGGLGDIVMVPSVKEARTRNVLKTIRPFKEFTEKGVIWKDGTYSQIDSVIWCTGFKPALEHLRDLNVIESDGMVKVNGTRSLKEPRLWLVGYGDWVGYASATLVGVTRVARDTAIQVAESLGISRKG